MEIYSNEKQLKSEIMQSRHLFIYGYDTNCKSDFLKGLESEYPVNADSKEPVVLYLNNFGLPKTGVSLKDKDSYYIHRMSSEYLSLSMATRLLERTLELDKNVLGDRLSRLISLISKNRNTKFGEILTLEDLLREVKSSRDFYYKSYIDYINGKIDGISIDDVSIPFLQLEFFASIFKEQMNIDSYLAFILDKKYPFISSSAACVNDYVGSRINKDISIKVATEPDDWETYRDSNGQFVEYIHDYGDVELDSSKKDSLKLAMKKRGL